MQAENPENPGETMNTETETPIGFTRFKVPLTRVPIDTNNTDKETALEEAKAKAYKAMEELEVDLTMKGFFTQIAGTRPKALDGEPVDYILVAPMHVSLSPIQDIRHGVILADSAQHDYYECYLSTAAENGVTDEELKAYRERIERQRSAAEFNAGEEE